MGSEVKRDWNTEDEGRLAEQLRRLAHAESEEERTPALEQLRTLSGLDFGDDMSRWLAWYLEEHLGLRNALGILKGTALPHAQEKAEAAARLEEIVFERAEYNWCALERIKNKDDMVKLRMLYSDLESPIRTDMEGPFSFRRLTGLEGEDLAFFAGKSLTEALFHELVQVRHLRVLKDYGKMMMMPVFPSATQRAGAIVYATAISQALVRFDSKITSLSYKDLQESLPGLLERPYLVESYGRLFQEALEKCK